jgi:hypothetical protein
MEVDAFGKGGGGGRGKGGKETKTCHHCGKVGHLQSDCWAKGAGGKGKGGGKGAGKKGAGGGKGTSPDASKTCWNCGKTGHMQSECWVKKGESKGKGKAKGKKYGAGSWDDEETLAIENGVAAFSAESLDMCSIEASSAISAPCSWIRCCLDTGAARSAFPSTFAPDLAATPAHGVSFKTATAEIVSSEGVKRILVVTENGRRTAIKGHGAPVHKVLVAGSGVVEQGQDLYLGSDGGYIMEPGFSQALRLAFANVQKERGDRELTPVYLENGVFNFYVKREAKEPGWGSQRPCGRRRLDEYCRSFFACRGLVGGPAAGDGAISPPVGPAVPDSGASPDDRVEEAQAARVQRDPGQPTRAEKEDHEVTGHVSFRTWCKHCLAGRGRGQPHLGADGEEEGLPAVGIDYGFMGQDDDKVMPMLCCKASRTRSYACSTVDKKGPTIYAVSFLVGWLRQLGHKRILWRGDNEPSLLALRNAVSKALPEIELVPRDSPPGDHAANGFAETGVRELKGIIRTMKSALEEKLGRRLEKDDPLLAWLPRHAASMLSRYRLGENGKTAEQMRTGKKWRKPAVEFGELLLFRPIMLGGGRKRDFSARMLEGIYVGHHERTGSVMVLTAEGATRGIGIARVPLERRWCAEGRAVFRGLPWKLKPAGRAA